MHGPVHQHALGPARRLNLIAVPESQLSSAQSVATPPQAAPSLPDQTFGKDLVECSRGLRAFARSLSRNQDLADDLVQETMLRAWKARALFEPGSNLQAWTRVILRNLFLSAHRRSRFVGQWDDRIAERKLVSAATQAEQIDLADVARGLDRLPKEQREAVLLFGEQGLSIEEIAAATGVATGTVKSRIARGRAALKQLLEHDPVLGSRSAVAQGATSPPVLHSAAIESQRLAAARKKRRQELYARRAMGITLIG